MKHHFWYSAKQLNYLASLKEEAPHIYEKYMALRRMADTLPGCERMEEHVNTVELGGKEVVYTEWTHEKRPSGLWDDYVYLGGSDTFPKIRTYLSPQASGKIQ